MICTSACYNVFLLRLPEWKELLNNILPNTATAPSYLGKTFVHDVTASAMTLTAHFQQELRCRKVGKAQEHLIVNQKKLRTGLAV
jgi:hypothetical protein